MSTWLYLECRSHEPALPAADESGQHLYDLPRIRQEYADREALVRLFIAGETDFGYFTRHTVQFLAAHQVCEIGLRDEYGDEHSLIATEES